MKKKTNISAIYKGKGSKKDPSNYRPISVLPILARVFEKIMARQFSNFNTENQNLPNEQYGFRNNSGCETLLISAINSWYDSIDNGKFTGALLIDLSKAFDNVPHQKLLLELSKMGIGIKAGLWFKNYLENRFQRVKINKDLAAWKRVTKSVPQGGGLSPEMFNSYMRDLPKEAESETYQFADDITHSESDTSIQVVEEKLIKAFMKTKKFCEEHDLTINTKKTQLIIFKAPRKRIPVDLEINLDGTLIKPQSNVKLLGVTLDQNLAFNKQIEGVINKCNSSLAMISRAASKLPKELLKMAYIGLVRSHMEYASSIYMTVAKRHLEKLDRIQKKAVRLICHAPRNSHAAPLMEELKLETLEKRRKDHILKIVDNIIERKCHPALMNMFQENKENDLLEIKTTKTVHGKKRFCITGAIAYNEDNAITKNNKKIERLEQRKKDRP